MTTAEPAAQRRASRVGTLRRVPTATLLVALVGALCIVGTVMVGSASEVVAIDTYGSPWAILIRQCLWLGVGTIAMVVAIRMDYRVWRRFGRVLLIAAFAGLLLVLVPHVGAHVTGSTRWLGFGSFDVQPSEIMKFALAVFGADLVVRREDAGGAERTVMGPLVLTTCAAAGLVLLQPDMGTAVVICWIGFVLLLASGISLRPLVKVVAGIGLLAVVVGVADPYRRQRILAFLDPSAHASGSGYQVVQSLIGLGSGHLFGVGLGSGFEKWGYLPNAQTDFIFSVIGQELGIVGALCVLALLGALCWFGLRAAQHAPDRFGNLLGVALVTWIGVETLINVGAVIGLLPVTGIPLPFISYGGSSLVVTMAAAGVVVSIARHERADARRLVAGRAPGAP